MFSWSKYFFVFSHRLVDSFNCTPEIPIAVAVLSSGLFFMMTSQSASLL